MNENTDGFVPTNYEERIKPPLITFSLLLIGLAILGVGIALNLMPLDLGALTVVMMIIGGVLVISSASYTIGRSRHINTEKDFDETRFYNWVLNNHGIVLSKDEVAQLHDYNFIVKDGVRYIMHYEIKNGEIVGYLLFDKPVSSFEFTSSLPIIPEETNPVEETFEEEIPELETEEALIKEIEDVSNEEIEEPVEAEPIIVIESIQVEETHAVAVAEPKKPRKPRAKKVVEIAETPVEEEAVIEAEPLTEEPAVKKPRKPRAKKVDYSSMKLEELRKAAKDAGIKGYYKLKKEELLNALQG